jgi:transcriptional regulator of met regulon
MDERRKYLSHSGPRNAVRHRQFIERPEPKPEPFDVELEAQRLGEVVARAIELAAQMRIHLDTIRECCEAIAGCDLSGWDDRYISKYAEMALDHYEMRGNH